MEGLSPQPLQAFLCENEQGPALGSIISNLHFPHLLWTSAFLTAKLERC